MFISVILVYFGVMQRVRFSHKLEGFNAGNKKLIAF